MPERVTGEIKAGFVILLGVGGNDAEAEAEMLVNKIANLRIFADSAGKFNLSAMDAKAEMLVVSQFTLYADCRKGRRPSFTDAARPGNCCANVRFVCNQITRAWFYSCNRRIRCGYAC